MNTTKANPRTDRKNATLVGVLYIVGTAAGIMSLVSTSPLLEGPDFLTQVSRNPNQIVIGALFLLTMCLALALIPVLLFPILKRYNETFAVGYVLFRGALEAAIQLALVVGWLCLPLIGQAYGRASAVESSYLQSLGDLVLEAHGQTGHLLTIVFILGALMFYAVLYQSRLVPRWISGWGLLAAIPYLISGVLGLFALLSPMSNLQMVMVLPLALQEMVLAIWLIAKGFNASDVKLGAVQVGTSPA